MKMSAGKRVLMIIHWACSLLIALVLAACILFPDALGGLYNSMRNGLGNAGGVILSLVLLIIYLLIAAAQIYMILEKRPGSEKGFVTMDSGDDAQIRLSAQAIEQMVRKAVYNVEGITDLNIDVDENEQPVIINVGASILNGCHIPTLTANIKSAIRKFVESDCGVPVGAVDINIRSVAADDQVVKNKHLPFGKRAAKAALMASAIPAPTMESLNNAPATGDEGFESIADEAQEALEQAAAEETWEEPFQSYEASEGIDEETVEEAAEEFSEAAEEIAADAGDAVAEIADEAEEVEVSFPAAEEAAWPVEDEAPVQEGEEEEL